MSRVTSPGSSPQYKALGPALGVPSPPWAAKAGVTQRQRSATGGVMLAQDTCGARSRIPQEAVYRAPATVLSLPRSGAMFLINDLWKMWRAGPGGSTSYIH